MRNYIAALMIFGFFGMSYAGYGEKVKEEEQKFKNWLIVKRFEEQQKIQIINHMILYQHLKAQDQLLQDEIAYYKAVLKQCGWPIDQKKY